MNTRRFLLLLTLFALSVGEVKESSAFYNPGTGRWLSKDPLGDKAFSVRGPYEINSALTFLPSVRLSSELNPYAFVVNNPLDKIDYLGLDWHHLLPQAVFSKENLKKWGIDPADLDIHDKKYGWELDPHIHTGKGGLHPSGWNGDWRAWVSEMEASGKTIDKCSIEKHLKEVMIPKYKDFLDLGSPATKGYYSSKLTMTRTVTTLTGTLILFSLIAGEVDGSNAEAVENLQRLTEKCQTATDDQTRMDLAAQMADQSAPLFGMPSTVIFSMLLYQMGLVK